jgi:hypothetical protein
MEQFDRTDLVVLAARDRAGVIHDEAGDGKILNETEILSSMNYNVETIGWKLQNVTETYSSLNENAEMVS